MKNERFVKISDTSEINVMVHLFDIKKMQDT